MMLTGLKLRIKSVDTGKLKRDVDAGVALALQNVGDYVVERTSAEASKKLHTTADTYIAGLHQPESVKITKDSVTVSLVGETAVALEDGYAGFDMKPGLLGGKDYRDIPMVRLTPGSKTGQPMSWSAYKGALQGKPKIFPGISYTKSVIGKGTVNVEHKTGMDTDVQRSMMPAKGSTYLVFRRVSKKSPASSWIHPGWSGTKIFDLLDAEFDRKIPMIVAEALAKFGIGTEFK